MEPGQSDASGVGKTSRTDSLALPERFSDLRNEPNAASLGFLRPLLEPDTRPLTVPIDKEAGSLEIASQLLQRIISLPLQELSERPWDFDQSREDRHELVPQVGESLAPNSGHS